MRDSKVMAARPHSFPPLYPRRRAGSLFVRLLAGLAGLASGLPVLAGEWDVSGYVGLESRGFWQDARYPGQDGGLEASFIVQPEFRWRSEDGNQRVSIVAFARADAQDSERSHVDLREAYWSFEADDWDLTLGVNKVFWGVTESRHLVDVINQTDGVEDLDGEDKLGQPMINLNLQRDWGRIGLYLLPWFRERTFPGVEGRLRGPLPVDDDRAIYESAAGQHHLDLAVRYSHYFGDVDIGAYLFEGTSREPRFLLSPGGDRLLPVYEQITQFGIDLQLTRDAWLWKLEAIARDADSDSFAAVVGGFEYTFFGVRESAADLGILVEALYDGRSDPTPPTVFDNDLFLGARLALNDIADTSVLAGIAVDVDTQEAFLNLEAERRFGDNLSAELRLRAFTHAEAGDALYPFESDDYVQIRLSWFY